MKLFTAERTHLWTGKNWLNFETHPDPYPGICLKNSLPLRDGHFVFDNVAHISGKTDRIFMKISSQTYLWTRKSPLIFDVLWIWSPTPVSGYWLQIRLGGGLRALLLTSSPCCVHVCSLITWLLLLQCVCYLSIWKKTIYLLIVCVISVFWARGAVLRDLHSSLVLIDKSLFQRPSELTYEARSSADRTNQWSRDSSRTGARSRL